MSKQRGVFERKPGQWYVRYVDASGRLRRERAGTKAGATKLYHKRKGEALDGRKLPERIRQAPLLFDEIARDAELYIEKRYARPAEEIARMAVVKNWFVGRAADAITPADVESSLEQAEKEKRWKASTFNHHLTLISLVYRLAIRNRKAKENPARAVQRRKEDNSRVRFLTPDEEAELRKVIRSRPEWAGHLPEFELALHTGLRRTDMYKRLVWESVNLAGRTASIARSKNGDPMHAPLNDDAIRALLIFRSRGDGRGRVVRNAEGHPLNVNGYWFPAAVRASRIADFHWHDLRHTFASRLRQAGVPLGTIAELMGHRTLMMTRRDAHLSIANLQEAVARISTDTKTDTRPPSAFAYVQ